MNTHISTLNRDDQKALAACPGLVGDEWEQVIGRIPVDLEATARETRALQRKREVKSASDLLRLVLGYAVCDWSFRLLALWATVLGLADLSDVAARKRLRHTRQWLGRILGEWLAQRRLRLTPRPVRLRLIDASVITQPGSRGTDWRLHASFDLGGLCLDGVEVTDASGGETLARHAAQAGDIVVADRGYAHRAGLGTLLAVAVWLVVRLNVHNLPLETADGEKFDILQWLQADPTATQPREVAVWVTTPAGRFELRLIAQRLPDPAAEAARRRVQQTSRKKGHTPSQASLIAAGFILVVTNLPALAWPAEQVLAVYRVRWQVELVFKRLKSLLDLNRLRAKDPELAQVYLLGKLLALVLLEGWTRDWTSDLADWFTDTARPFSLWRWTQVWADALRQVIRGPLSLAQLLTALPRLARYLCDAPRKRRQQLAQARRWLEALGLTVDLSNSANVHEPALAS